MNKKPLILDVTGKPIVYGNDDPNIISVDDTPKFEFRKDTDFPNVPFEVKKAELQYIVPMARFIANTLGIDFIEEKTYEKVLEQLKQKNIFVVLNLEGVKITEGVAEWYGLIVMCKKHALVMVKTKMQIATGKIGISQYRLWSKERNHYIIYGDKTQKTLANRDEVTSHILNYLNIEGVVKV